MKYPRSQSGFTLVELAIVLVIIGLIVGGVLVGQDLIKAASIRATVTQIEKFNAAATTFRGKYGGIPGDLSNMKALEFGFNTAANDAGRDGTAGKGDGNGLLEGCGANYTYALGCETVLFWSDLSKAGLIPFQSSLTSITGVTQINKTTANLLTVEPTVKVREGVLFNVFTAASRNFYGTSPWITGGTGAQTVNNGLTPLEARGIDDKLDDGMPLTGIITSITQLTVYAMVLNTVSTPCVAAAGGYLTDTDAHANTNACALAIRASF